MQDTSDEIDHDATTTMVMTQQSFLGCIARSDEDKQRMQGKDEYDFHATLKISCCCLQDAMMTVPPNATISGANIPRLSTASMPKKACKHAKDSVYTANSMYVAKGKYLG